MIGKIAGWFFLKMDIIVFGCLLIKVFMVMIKICLVLCDMFIEYFELFVFDFG